MSVPETRWMMAVALLGVVFLAGPLYVSEAAGAEAGSETGFFQKMKNNINSWFDDDGHEAKKNVKKSVKKAEKSTKKAVKKTSPQAGPSGGQKALSFIKKRAKMASDNVQKSIDKDKKTLSRKFKTSGD